MTWGAVHPAGVYGHLPGGGVGRIRDVLPALVKKTGLPISVDTFYPWVAQRALEAGASILNDVTGFGPEMLAVAAGSRCGCVVMDPAPPAGYLRPGEGLFPGPAGGGPEGWHRPGAALL